MKSPLWICLFLLINVALTRAQYSESVIPVLVPEVHLKAFLKFNLISRPDNVSSGFVTFVFSYFCMCIYVYKDKN
jgi:hypothetical protein